MKQAVQFREVAEAFTWLNSTRCSLISRNFEDLEKELKLRKYFSYYGHAKAERASLLNWTVLLMQTFFSSCKMIYLRKVCEIDDEILEPRHFVNIDL